MTANEINEFFGISESFMLPERLMGLLFSDEINGVFEKYSAAETDLSRDRFTDYFQEEHSSRKAMMQDFTPPELSALAARIAAGEPVKSCLDLCAGTGGLTIALWNVLPGCDFVCEELSQRALPLLLFNLAVRNVSAFVSNKNILSGEVIRNYRIIPGERFGKVEVVDSTPEMKFDVCVTNPPYSLKYEFDEKKTDARFAGYGYPPKQFADMAFIMDGLSRLNDKGRVIAILPHGVLFRGNREEIIRREMVKRGNIHTVIGLPDKLFLNTGIPVAVMVFGKERAEAVSFVDASREYEKFQKLNRLRERDIEKILSAVSGKAEIPKYSHAAGIAEIEQNSFNLNIPRYVDTYEPPPEIDIFEVVDELERIKAESRRLECEIYKAITQLVPDNEKTARGLAKIREFLERATQNE